MKLLLDQGLPRSAAELLRQAGRDAVHTGEIGLATADDSVILQEARNSQRVVVTLDADFHTLLALSGAASPSVVRIRIEGLRGAEVAKLIEDVIGNAHDDLLAGAVVTVQQARIRVRKLPIS
jgi:predicted nuclease of predicted toxin-antitoxin system